MAQTKKDLKLLAFMSQLAQLDNDELWELVCQMFPDADQETLEDLFDSLVATLAANEPMKDAAEVFAEEDRRRGLTS